MESPAGRAVPLKQRQASGSGVGAEEDISYGVGCNGARISPLSPPLVFVPRSVLARNPSAQSARHSPPQRPQIITSLTLGICYERVPRFGGGVYHPILRRLEIFTDCTAWSRRTTSRSTWVSREAARSSARLSFVVHVCRPRVQV